jgi:Secretion system C-terminal sorting domain
MVKNILIFSALFLPIFGLCQFAPAANASGTTAIHKDSSAIVNWAAKVNSFSRGFEDVAIGGPLASYGDSTAALGYAEGTSTEVVSLGDAGEIVLGFQYPIKNDLGPDFAIFENSFSHDYLEFAHVEVSTDGINFIRIPSESSIQTSTQTGTFGTTLAEWTHNLAGKYIQGYGTPFDLEDISDSLGVNLDSINYVKIIDVVGSIDLSYGSFDALGTIINEPYPSAFESGGFDLDGVAVINQNNVSAGLQKEQSSIKVYPNPSQEGINIVGYSGIFQMHDMSGRKVLERTAYKNEIIDISFLESGMYILTTSKGSIKVQKN